MTRPGRIFLIAVLFFFAPLVSRAQDISNFSYKIVGNKIEVTYTLGGKASDRYKVALYNSLDKYASLVKLATGDVGDDITPGNAKKITWDAKEELGEFKGGLALKLKTFFIPFITFSLGEGEKLTMGKTNTVEWSGQSKNLKLQLYRGNRKMADLGNVSSAGQFDWNLPKKAFEKGSNYKIKGSASGREAFSNSFTLKNKLPIYIWIIPVAVVGGVVAIIAGGGGTTTEDSSIPPPIGPN